MFNIYNNQELYFGKTRKKENLFFMVLGVSLLVFSVIAYIYSFMRNSVISVVFFPCLHTVFISGIGYSTVFIPPRWKKTKFIRESSGRIIAIISPLTLYLGIYATINYEIFGLLYLHIILIFIGFFNFIFLGIYLYRNKKELKEIALLILTGTVIMFLWIYIGWDIYFKVHADRIGEPQVW